jgi:hypothetical protein
MFYVVADDGATLRFIGAIVQGPTLAAAPTVAPLSCIWRGSVGLSS